MNYFNNQSWDILVDELETFGSDTPFNCAFNQIEKMEFVDYSNYRNIEKPKKSNSNMRLGKKYGKRSGRFWKWTLSLTKDILNLERYQIFNTIGESTVKTMCKEHCLVYALQQQANIPIELVEKNKTYITRCHFPVSKLSFISEMTKINFHVKYYKNIDT